MKTSTLITALAATTAVAGAAYYIRRQGRFALAEDSAVIPIITPVIDLAMADYVLARIERLPSDEVTVILHTPGGCVTSCVLIADALALVPRSTAIVPYMAMSGGTLIALSATEIAMGRNAALSAVDPVVYGRRARHIEAGDEDGLHETAREYEAAMRAHLQDTLRARLLAHKGEAAVARAMEVFMGVDAPHEWPIHLPALRDLGLPVRPSERRWAEYVDARRDWYRR